MSSSLYITHEPGTVSRRQFDAFCAEHAIIRASSGDWRHGDVEVTWHPDRSSRDTYTGTVTFSTYWMGNAMPDVARLARAWWLLHGGQVGGSPELRPLFAHCCHQRREPLCDAITTAFPGTAA